MSQEGYYPYASFKEEEKVEGCSPSLWCHQTIQNGYKLEETTSDGYTTMLEGWNKAAESFPDNNCLGHIEGDKYVWRTYKEALSEAQALSKALFSENLVPETTAEDKTYRLMGLYSRNRPEWALTNWAIMHFSGTVVTLYNTLGQESLCYAIDHTQLSIVSCDLASFQKLLSFKKEGKIETLKAVICFDEFTAEEKEAFEGLGVAVHTFTGLVEKGRSLDDNILGEMTPPTPDTTDVICFTSGTTGMPKGAMISHRNFTSNNRGGEDAGMTLDENDVIMSYLPLAHCYEKWLVCLCLWRGVAIGYFNGNPLTLVKDIQMLKPTILPAVPRVLTKLYDTINMLMAKEEFKARLFKVALKQKQIKIKNELKFTHLLWDSVLFKYLRPIIGGRVRMMITGSAPISPEILNFLKCCFCTQIIEGYGQTETNAPASVTHPKDPVAGHVGGPMTNCYFKVEDIPDMEYLSSDKPFPRGELCVKGHNVFQGYFKNPEKNKEAFDEDGWLHTGDVVEVWTNGTIKLIDRKKNLFKLSQGEYISPEKLENVYNKSLFVAQIFIDGISTETHVVGIIVPDPDYCKLWASKAGIEKEGAELFAVPELREAMINDFAERAAKAKLNSLEKLTKFSFASEAFSVENGLLTPSMKLVRHAAKKRFRDVVLSLYSKE